MFGQFYNSSFRRYIVMMGALFNNVQVIRQRGENIHRTKVPISYSSKEKFMATLGKLNSITSQADIAKVETILPRMNLTMVDVMYNAQYKTGITNRSPTMPAEFRGRVSQYAPSPIKMIFELGIYTRHQDEMFQIVEQIIPYFQPHFTVKIKELHENDIAFERDIRVVFQSIAMDEVSEGDNVTRRRLEWSIMFEVNGWIYPPIAQAKGEIRTVYLDFMGNPHDLDPQGNFESFDQQVAPVDVDQLEWDGETTSSMSQGIPIPTDPEPPHPR